MGLGLRSISRLGPTRTCAVSLFLSSTLRGEVRLLIPDALKGKSDTRHVAVGPRSHICSLILGRVPRGGICLTTPYLSSREWSHLHQVSLPDAAFVSSRTTRPFWGAQTPVHKNCVNGAQVIHRTHQAVRTQVQLLGRTRSRLTSAQGLIGRGAPGE